MKKEFCILCSTTRDVTMTSSTIVDTGFFGERKIIQTRLFHCKICKGLVRQEDACKGDLLKADDNFTPRARSIWQSMPGDAQLKILNTVWCTQCNNMTGITDIMANVCSGMLVLRGKCCRCEAEVARVVENR